MGEIVNLRRVRKNAAKARDDAAAAENRIRFGRTSAEKAAVRLEAERLRRSQDGAKVDHGSGLDPGRAQPGVARRATRPLDPIR